jgi:hypothetical protein
MNTARDSSQHSSTNPIITDVRTGQELRDGPHMQSKSSSGPKPGLGARTVDDGEGERKPKEMQDEGCRKHGNGGL